MQFLMKKTANTFWWPDTLVYRRRYDGPFEIFARASSKLYFDRIAGVLDASRYEDFRALIERLEADKHTLSTSYERIESREWVGLELLCKYP